jgi:14-3-3 protein epsilon
MVEFVSNFFTGDAATEKLTPEQEVEERNIISAAYKNVVGNKRAELRVLTAIEQKESRRSQNDNSNLTYIRNYKHKIEKELRQYCSEILGTLEKVLIPRTVTLDSKVFYLKMKGDYNRYLAEFLLDEDYNKALE